MRGIDPRKTLPYKPMPLDKAKDLIMVGLAVIRVTSKSLISRCEFSRTTRLAS